MFLIKNFATILCFKVELMCNNFTLKSILTFPASD